MRRDKALLFALLVLFVVSCVDEVVVKKWNAVPQQCIEGNLIVRRR